MQKLKMLSILALGIALGISILVYVQNVSGQPLKPHESVDRATHVTGPPDRCTNPPPGLRGDPTAGALFYDDLDGDDIHDHDDPNTQQNEEEPTECRGPP